MKQKMAIATVLHGAPNGKPIEDKSGPQYDVDFETAISATGFGMFNLIVLAVAIPSGWASMLDTTSMSYIIPTAHCDLKLTLEQRGLLNATTYLGMITSAFFWGYLADTLGRKKLLVGGYLIDGFFVLLAGISQNYAMILFAKYMTGFIINGPFAALTSMISEFHCAKYRAKVLMLMGIIYNFANLCIPCLAWLILPTNMDVSFFEGKFELHSWNFFILMCAIPSLISSAVHLFLPESPKFLMTVGRNDEALKVFQRVYSLNTGKPPETFPIKSLVDEIKSHTVGKHGGVVTANRTKIQALKEGWQQMTPLFFAPHIMNLVLVCCIQTGFMMGLNTLRLWIPQIFTAMNDYQTLHQNETASLCTMLEIITPNKNVTTEECVVNTVSDFVYINAIIVAATSILGYLMAGLIINKLGKKLVIIMLGSIGGCCGLSIYFAQSSGVTTALASILIAFVGICANVLITVVVDLFPTSLRTMTVSLTMMCGRTGAMIGNVVFPYLLATGCLPPFVMVGSVTVACAILASILPKTDLKALE